MNSSMIKSTLKFLQRKSVINVQSKRINATSLKSNSKSQTSGFVLPMTKNQSFQLDSIVFQKKQLHIDVNSYSKSLLTTQKSKFGKFIFDLCCFNFQKRGMNDISSF